MKKKILSFSLIFACFFALAQQQTMYIQNAKLYKKDGQKIILRGLNYNLLDSGNIYLVNNSQSYIAFIDQVALTGANSIRIPWFTDEHPHWRKNYPNTGTPQVALDNGMLSSLIGYCHQKNLVPILELHDFTCGNNWSDFMVKVQNWWLQPNVLSLIQQHKEYLIINIANEFGKVRWTPNTTTSLITFKNNYKQLVSNFRNAGIDVPIMIDAPDCGQSSSELLAVAPEIRNSDPLNKIIFSGHSYWYGYAPTISDVTTKINEAVNSNVCFVFGEVSNRQDVTGIPADGVFNIDYTYQTILSQSCQKEIGWLIWTFNHDWNSERKISPTSNVNNLTVFGQDVLHNPNYGLLTTNCGNSTLSTINVNEDKSYKIFPNPSKDHFSVDATDIILVEVYSLDGRLLITCQKNFDNISVSELKNGVYQVIIKTKTKIFSDKLIIQK